MDEDGAMNAIVDAHVRWKTGEISTLTAAIEQIRALLTIQHIPGGNQLVEALSAFNDGDRTKLDTMVITGRIHCPDC